ncbi:MAG: response regulator [Actinomycetota bacterium]|nr:response regulator [Actinomycetota bacterium]
MNKLAPTMRVLVADDDEDHRFLTIRALRKAKGKAVEVEGVRDGREALDYIERRGRFADRARPHLLVLDLKMPRLNGLEVLERLKGDPDLCTIPIVMLSASDRPEDVDAAYRRGSNSYVTKPSGPGGMREGVRAMSEYWTSIAELPEPPQ